MDKVTWLGFRIERKKVVFRVEATSPDEIPEPLGNELLVVGVEGEDVPQYTYMYVYICTRSGEVDEERLKRLAEGLVERLAKYGWRNYPYIIAAVQRFAEELDLPLRRDMEVHDGLAAWRIRISYY